MYYSQFNLVLPDQTFSQHAIYISNFLLSVCLRRIHSVSACRKRLHSSLSLQLRVVAGQLQADADVVLHPADLSGESHSVPLESGCTDLELVGVDFHLLPQPQPEPTLVFRDQGLVHVNPPLLQHDHDQLTHGVLDSLRGQHADSVRLLVDIERYACVSDKIEKCQSTFSNTVLNLTETQNYCVLHMSFVSGVVALV